MVEYDHEATSRPATSPEARQKALEAKRRLFDAGLLVSTRHFARSKVPADMVFNLYMYVDERIPRCDHGFAIAGIKEAVFAEALRVLERQTDVQEGWDAAISWIDGIDLLTFNVEDLPHVKPQLAAGWQELMNDEQYRATVRAAQGSRTPPR